MPPPAMLDGRLHFPDPRAADAEGLVAIGGDLSALRHLELMCRLAGNLWPVRTPLYARAR